MANALGPSRQRQPMCNECEKALPNQIVFDKIESIIRLLQDEQKGLPVKTAKSFMSKIPSVFTGADLIQWMMRNLNLDDQQEAVHLANLIASHGYIFPIEDHTLSIKNDCTFYRFQTPCLWPSNNLDPENTDYAVYLCKRTMQGKARLELADYEAENLARLQKMFSRKWEFIFLQAESQAKVDKKRDKLERKVLDSQERAFWDVYRPVPGCVNTTELDIKKACRLSKSAKRCAECQRVAAEGGVVQASIRSGSVSAPSPEVQQPTPTTTKLPTASIAAEQAKEANSLPEETIELLPAAIKSDSTNQGEQQQQELKEPESSESIAKEATSEQQAKVTEEEAASQQFATSNKGEQPASTHRHHHHGHHHHHHHHPHSHHHHHHHHRQCPHHKLNQKKPSASSSSCHHKPQQAVQSSEGGEALDTFTGDNETRERLLCSHKRSAGSVDQFMRVPSLQATSSTSGRRRSECNRMLSVGNEQLEPEERRPASACCTPSGEISVAATAAAAATTTGPNARKSSLDGLPVLCGQHSPLKGSQSVRVAEPPATGEQQRYIGDLERELEALRVRLDRRAGGVKMSKVTQSYLSYFKQWAEYDPFVAQPTPSNPWISDSTELWDSERQTKDVNCRRVRRWAFSLKELLNDPAGREQFHKFLEKEFSAENLKFWDAVQELKRVHSRDVAKRVEAIWIEYLAQDANCPINIDSKSYETSRKNMAKNKNNRYIFDEAAGHVYQLMKNDSYPRYLRSEMYKDYKEASERKRTNQVAFDVFKPQINTLKHKFNF